MTSAELDRLNAYGTAVIAMERKAIAAALRKRAAWFPQDDPRWQDAIIELRLAADLIEKGDLP